MRIHVVVREIEQVGTRRSKRRTVRFRISADTKMGSAKQIGDDAAHEPTGKKSDPGRREAYLYSRYEDVVV